MKKIVGFGDSWMWGDELIDPALSSLPDVHPVMHQNTDYREQNCFLGLLGKHYNLPTENFGIPGGSLLSTMWCYLWWLEHGQDHKNSIVVVALTGSSRTSWYNPKHTVYSNDKPWNRFVHSTWLQASGARNYWGDLSRLYTTLTDCEQLSQLNYQQAVYFFQGQKHRHPVYMLSIAEPPCQLDIPEMVLPQSTIAWLRNQARSRPEPLFKPKNHPNELGHEIIRDLLINHIDHAIM